MRAEGEASGLLCTASSIQAGRLRDLEVHCARSEGSVGAQELRIRHLGWRDPSRVQPNELARSAFNPAYCHFVILPSLELAGNSARDERSETHHRVQNRNPVGFASLDQP
jgi:hypothetical protein